MKKINEKICLLETDELSSFEEYLIKKFLQNYEGDESLIISTRVNLARKFIEENTHKKVFLLGIKSLEETVLAEERRGHGCPTIDFIVWPNACYINIDSINSKISIIKKDPVPREVTNRLIQSIYHILFQSVEQIDWDGKTTMILEEKFIKFNNNESARIELAKSYFPELRELEGKEFALKLHDLHMKMISSSRRM